MKKKGIFGRITIYFFNGLLIILPIAVTIYLIQWVYGWLNNLGLKWLLKVGIDFPGAGIIVVLSVILLIGILGRFWITKRLFAMIEAIIQKVPMVKDLYNIVQEILQSFIGDKKTFDQVVLVKVGETSRLGFLTVDKPLVTKDGQSYIGVYFPHSMQVSGDLHWVEKEKIEEVNISVDEALKMIISAGMTGKK
jgi:uncharacterized membrane protein